MKIKPLNEKLVQLTKILSDGCYHDGTALGEVLQVTRSAVWKIIKKLEQYDVAIDSIPGKGYSLKEPLILLEPELILKDLPYPIELTVVESIASTNDYFKISREGEVPSKIACCLAEHQTQGRGRLNRTWHAPFGKNIYLSCFYPFQKDMSELAGLSLVVGLSILSALRPLGFTKDVGIKWPNDVLCHEKKMAGILIEVQAESHGVSYITIGIGLNVNMTYEDDPSINQSWTSLCEETGATFDRNYLVALLLQHLLEYLHRFEQEGFSAFTEEWATADALVGKKVTLDRMSERISGEVMGINGQGHLLLRSADGKLRAFSSGDTFLMK